MRNDIHDDAFIGRLRSVRRRKRHAYEDRDKQLLGLYRELNVIGSVPPLWVKLEHPYQRGWERFFVLREDVKRDQRATFYQKILDKINTRQLSSRADFKKRTRNRRRKRYEIREQELADVCVKEFMSDKFTDKERACFIPVARYDRSMKVKYFDYRFADPWRFVLCVRPNLVTHVRVIDTRIESRMAYIYDVLEQENKMNRVFKLLHGHNRYRRHGYFTGKYNDPFANRSFADILDEHWPPETGRDIKNLPVHREVFAFIAALLQKKSLVFLLRRKNAQRCATFGSEINIIDSDAVTDIHYAYAG